MSLILFFRLSLLLLEIMACAAAFVAMPRLKNSFWKWMPFYLLAIVMWELLGYYLADVPALKKYNPMMYNYFISPIMIVFPNWLLYKNVQLYNKAKANWVLYGIGVYLVCLLIDWLLIPESSLWVTTFSYCVGIVILLFSILLFFYFYINSDDIIFFKKDTIFWICLGLFLYYVAALPFEGLRNTLLKHPSLFLIGWYIDMGLNCLMYCSFIIAFVWAKQR